MMCRGLAEVCMNTGVLRIEPPQAVSPLNAFTANPKR